MLEQANVGGLDGNRLHGALGDWSSRGQGTLARRLAQALRQAIRAGLISDGTRLPAERALAARLAVSRSTVSAALDELRADGLVSSRQGSGTVVTFPLAGHETGTRLAEHFSVEHGIDLLTGNPADVGHLPPLRIDIAGLLASADGPGISPLGLRSLRAALAGYHSERGLYTEPEQIHVTSGAHHAIGIALGVLAGPGDAVGLEDPGYPGVFDLIDHLRARTVALPTDRLGVVPGELDRLLRSTPIPVVYLQTGPHNPTGRVPSDTRLAELAQVLDRHDSVVVEDRTLADLAFGNRPGPQLGPRCRRATVITIGSFSKVAWAGLRIGWLRAPEAFIERTRVQRLTRDLGTSIPSQVLAGELVDHLDALGQRRREEMELAVGRARRDLAELVPEWTVDPPQGGSVLWLRTPLAETDALAVLAAHHGVRVAPGSIARCDRRPDPHLRICVDRPQVQTDAGIRRLAAAWRELLSATRRAAR